MVEKDGVDQVGVVRQAALFGGDSHPAIVSIHAVGGDDHPALHLFAPQAAKLPGCADNHLHVPFPIGGLAASTTYSFTVAAVNSYGVSAQSAAAQVTTGPNPTTPDFGPNVDIFDTSMPMANIQSRINAIYSAQQGNQFGPARNAVLFKPGTYSVDIPVGFYTQVVGLGALPTQVSITNVHSDAYLANGNATQNFWRGLENFSVTAPPGAGMKWAVSQACPFRRMSVPNNNIILFEQSGSQNWSSGGWMSDSIIRYDVTSGGKLDPATWPNTGIGRINPDGSEGSCAAHYRYG